MRFLISVVVAALLLASHAVLADDLVATDLKPMRHPPAQLVVVAPDGNEITYTQAELEELTTYSLTTTTPWRDVPAQFEGVLLSDVLAANGLDRVPSILVTAENDFTTTFSRALLDTVPVLVATRVDGRPHSRRARGPIQFVIGADTHASSNLTSEANFVWMAARIEPGA
ncbi:MAG: hypothetical protein V2I76_13185 [Roseobacter sp.]|jgi:hypothetical protein|nr:hypothetical protein [Roseobacter sp.]